MAQDGRGKNGREGGAPAREYLCLGLVAHVDAGKTTLSEAILHGTGAIRSAGRVDHGDAFLDTDAMEKGRGITIFSKQASFTTYPWGASIERVWTLVDTPGHADFSTEMERALQVLDYAVLIISAADGVTGQARLLWRLLAHYGVPTFLFVNKMDQPGADRSALGRAIRRAFGTACVDMQDAFEGARRGPARFSPVLQEEIAVCDDALMEKYLEALSQGPQQADPVTVRDAARLVGERKLFPLCFGSALREEGVDILLAMLDALARAPRRPEAFGARVYKITHDESGARLSWIKVTGGSMLPRQVLAESLDEKGQAEKASQLRFYRGAKYEALQEAPAGMIVAVPGLSGTRAGQGLGGEAGADETGRLLQPVLQSRLLLPEGIDLYAAYRRLRALEEEEPMLRLSYDEDKKEITVQLMGQVQREILEGLIEKRFGMQVGFGPSRIIYKETIAEPAEGVGHFEPLRHYAEVHLLLEPGEPGSGLVFESRCSVNDLALNWQRLILTHLEERRHRGVLTGAEITDMKISILGGRAHAKHTEGGDFRKATYRAVRQGLMMARSVLLEPSYDFVLTLPRDNIGRAMADLQRMDASFGPPEFSDAAFPAGTLPAGGNPAGLSAPAASPERGRGGLSSCPPVPSGSAGDALPTGGLSGGGDMAVLRGTVTVAALGSYVEEVAAYTRGAGSLQCALGGYLPCRDAEAVIAASGYDPELDVRNPSSSVFCSHGAGTIVPWYEVRSFMHVDTGWRFPDETPAMTEDQALDLAAERARQAALEREERKRLLEEDPAAPSLVGAGGGAGKKDIFKRRQQAAFAADKELMQIFERTYGPIRPRRDASDGAGDPDAGFRPPGFAGAGRKKPKDAGPRDHYLLVDGYNIIYAWEDLRELAGIDIKAARDKLMDVLSNFAGYREEKVILVFDAYKVPGGRGEVLRWHNIDVIFTREAETADLYIEKTAQVLAKKYRVTVATSDAVEQVIIFGAGACRMSARMLREEILFSARQLRDQYGIGADE